MDGCNVSSRQQRTAWTEYVEHIHFSEFEIKWFKSTIIWYRWNFESSMLCEFPFLASARRLISSPSSRCTPKHGWILPIKSPYISSGDFQSHRLRSKFEKHFRFSWFWFQRNEIETVALELWRKISLLLRTKETDRRISSKT